LPHPFIPPPRLTWPKPWTPPPHSHIITASEQQHPLPSNNKQKQLLDFPRWPEWLKNGLIITSKRKAGPQLQKGDKIKSNFNGNKVKPVVIENSPATFQWKGNFGHGLVVGHRRFFFKESQAHPGWTTLVQDEDIKGLLAFMFEKGEKGQGKIARDAMRKFNEDLKARVELGLGGVN